MITRGLTSIVEQPTTYTNSLKTGGTTTRTFIGNEVDIVAKKNELLAQGYETSIKQGPKWELTANYAFDLSGGQTPGTETEIEPQTVWQVSAQAGVQKFIDIQNTYTSQLSPSTFAKIEESLKDPRVKPYDSTDASQTSQNVINIATDIATLKRFGVEGKSIFFPQVSRTITVNTNYVFNWSIENVNKVLSKSSLITLKQVPSYLHNLLPTSGTEASSNASTIVYFYGYLENFPTYQTVGNNKIQISQTWSFGRYPVVIYPQGEIV